MSHSRRGRESRIFYLFFVLSLLQWTYYNLENQNRPQGGDFDFSD
jgi:hypothetical protein